MSALKTTIDALAQSFAQSIIVAIRSASLDDILRLPGDAGGGVRPSAASTVDVATRVTRTAAGQKTGRADRIVEYIRAHPGSSGPAARKALGFPSAQWATYVARAIKAGRLRRVGERRKARYWAV
jgi:hypothetical protein